MKKNTSGGSFTREIITDLEKFLKREEARFPADEILRIDMHCHDCGSDVPDERLGKILNVPETWLESEKLIEVLSRHGCTAHTITNHNNAKSCYYLQEKGYDILTAAEFTVTVPDFGTRIHVLTYGFTLEQEKKLNKLRESLPQFLQFAHENDIPTVWAHPLYHYRSSSRPSLELYEKLSVMFNRFEVMNGQRDTWQNMLIRNWLDDLTEEKIDSFAKKHKVDWKRYTDNPYRKGYTGGSDEHMGIFLGLTGTRLHIPGLKRRLESEKASELALEAIKANRMSVFGGHHDHEKMMVAFIDYFCQIGLHMQDPGLFRILLHKGDAKEKLLAFLVSNGFAELRRHKMTSRFIEIIHNAFQGEKPSLFIRLLVKKAYQPVVREVTKMSMIHEAPPEQRALLYKESIESMYTHLLELLAGRIRNKMRFLPRQTGSSEKFSDIIESFDIPSHVRALGSRPKSSGNIRLGELMDGLPFPFLATSVIAAATFASTKVLYNARSLLETFSKETGVFIHPKRMLWLTDTFEDNNGVSMVLREVLEEIRRRKLPIDLCVCSDKLESGPNLVVLKPVAEFTVPFYRDYTLKVPNIITLQKIFKENEYDRLMCSTEGVLGFASIYLKKAFSVPGYFYIHTDWMTFAKRVLDFNKSKLDKMKRVLRFFYDQFDKVFVLNSDQRDWLTSSKIGFPESKVALTAHWVDAAFKPMPDSREKLFGLSKSRPVLLFTGRISDEKGVLELPSILAGVRREVPDACLVIAGTGPAEARLREEIPDALFLGWVDHKKLPAIYSSADMLILPSKFDTFGCVVLEALSCGLPVVSYNTKGPKEIIINGECGFIESNRKDMIASVIRYLGDRQIRGRMKKHALKRAAYFSTSRILNELLADVGLQ